MIERLRDLIVVNHGTWRGFVRALLTQIEAFTGRLDQHCRQCDLNANRLVFVCLGNINRSPFAAAMARSVGANATSIGLSTTTGAPATSRAIEVSAAYGLDLAHHEATAMVDYQHRPDDLLVVMEVRHVKRLLAMGYDRRRIALLGHWGRPRRLHLHDPHTLADDYARTCFALIAAAVREITQQGLQQRAGFMSGPT